LAIRNRNIKKLSNFKFNYTFIKFIFDKVNFPADSKMRVLAKEIQKIRDELIIQNLPLAISRATNFRSKTSETHLSFMDLQGIASEGLINAVDKFVPPFRTQFRDVIIGRITGDLIEAYSETLLHFSPPEKRKIYRARKASRNHESDAFERLAQEVNSGPALQTETTATELQGLISGTSPLSSDAQICDTEEGSENFIDMLPCKLDDQPDIKSLSNEEYKNLKRVYKELSVFEVKLLKLKGMYL
jgi:DNA-directed RNA polymerase specialized sigma subunit